jgi:hypothetical protein
LTNNLLKLNRRCTESIAVWVAVSRWRVSEVLQEDDSPADWTSFRLAMLSNPAYNSKIEQVESSVAGQRIVRRLETAVMAVTPH